MHPQVEAIKADGSRVQEQARKSTPRLAAIDGLRGLAAMMVVFYHCWLWGGGTDLTALSLLGVHVPLDLVFITGYSGVYLFFVLSGFCLAYPFFSHPERKDDWRAYAMHRIRRILPPYLLSFLIFFLIGQWLHRVQVLPAEQFLYADLNITRFISRLFLIKSEGRIAFSYWTLVLEWRWYFFFPAMILLARRVSPALMAGVLFGVAYIAQQPLIAKILLHTTLDAVIAALPIFALGIWAARLIALKPDALHAWERWILKRPLLGLAAGILWFVWRSPSVRGAIFLERVVAWGPVYFFLILAALNQPGFKKIFGSPLFAKLGVFSYSIYLLQEPLIHGGHLFLEQPAQGGLQLYLTRYILLPVLCVVLAWGFHFIGERPFLKRPKK